MLAGTRNLSATVRESSLASVLFGMMLAVFSLLGSANLTGVTVTHAAGRPPFTVHGHLQEIPTPQAYHSATARFLDPAHYPLQLTQVRYFVVQGQLVDGQYQYPFQVDTAPGVAAEGMQVAMDEAAHREVIAVGLPYSVCATCGGGGGGGYRVFSPALDMV